MQQNIQIVAYVHSHNMMHILPVQQGSRENTESENVQDAWIYNFCIL